jgi:hypothetical protein
MTIRPTFKPRRYPDDIDYVTAIRELYQSLGGRHMRTKWVKGHQDDQYAYQDLSSEAQLNIDSDALASDHYWSGSGLKPMTAIPHFAECKVTVSINGIRYPSKIDQQLRYHINGSYLKQYLQLRYKWNEKVWNMIDFTSFGQIFAKLPCSKQVQQMKFTYNLQPIGEHTQRMSGNLTTENPGRCPCCKTDLETQFHLLQCRLNKQRSPAIAKFCKTGKARDGNQFIRIFTDLVEQWLVDPASIPTFEKCRDTFLRHHIIPLEYTSLVQQAVMEQTTIGWIHVMRGFLSKQWLVMAGSYYNTVNGKITNRNDGHHRIRRAIRAIHRMTDDIWHGRNEALHGHQQAAHDAAPKNLVDMEICQLHSKPDTLLATDSHYCETSLRQLLRSSASTKRRWLHRVKQSRARKANLLSKQPKITQYFHHQQTQPSPKDHHPPNTAPPPQCPSSRNTTTQRLLTQFFRERAPDKSPVPNQTSHTSPPPLPESPA